MLRIGTPRTSTRVGNTTTDITAAAENATLSLAPPGHTLTCDGSQTIVISQTHRDLRPCRPLLHCHTMGILFKAKHHSVCMQCVKALRMDGWTRKRAAAEAAAEAAVEAANQRPL